MNGNPGEPPAESAENAGNRGVWLSPTEFGQLQASLHEAQETLNAIRNGEVDAVVVTGSKGNKIYSLSGAEHPYRIYVEQMQEGAVTVTPEGLILYCNQRFAEMLGEPLDQVISSQLIPRLDAESWAAISTVLGDHEGATKHESFLQCAEGVALPVHFTASPLPLMDQTVICLVVTDLSLQKSGEVLRLAKEVAERSSAAKDSFLAALSHELRTPLTPALMGVATLQQERGLPAGVLTHLSMIRRNIELEIRLIDDLLDLTRIAHGKFELQDAEMDINSVLDRVLEICRSTWEAKNLTLTVERSAVDTRTVGDVVRLQQVLWNVIRNAVKFTPSGGSIWITTENPTPGAFRISVRDSGIGFNAAEEPQLFQPFEQVGREITRLFGGLGLGLSISRSIVSAHGGRIWGESPGPNKGATFHVEIPLRRSAQPSQQDDAMEAEPGMRRSLVILLVEDHDDTRQLLQMILSQKGHAVHAAATGEDALALAEKESFHLVISDLGLPDISGSALMSQLRSRYPKLRGVAVSGYGMEEDVRRSKESGFDHHLTKPVDPARLDRLIGELAQEIL
ncbi:PAS domain S-box-containing protein [Terrimicrobium sacchariphilum]|uniref:histidine kinase n=1 Tax=Terrimicrobium sacchariphilum TaxID=690879 RepID=A0A146G5L5_TERSA|nr:PAS domain-containing hybrid sensor histidine kinase/response regulator [Terrimicrobium sacchariphilum]GAT32692.1 PAS domain S-box-containing protein [Terrimicrobium sacchariphilum]